MNTQGKILLLLATAVALAAAPIYASMGQLFVLTEACIILIIAQSWNLLAGYGGILSLGQHLYVGVGAYGVMLLSQHTPVTPYALVFVSAALSVAVSILLLPLLIRLRNAYFAIGMWVMAAIVATLVSRIDVFGATYGLSLNIAHIGDVGALVTNTYILSAIVALAVMATTLVLTTGLLGLRVRSMRDDEIAAESIGVRTDRIRTTIFVLSGIGCALAGGLQSLSLSYISPQGAFDMNWMTTTIFIVIVGGIGSLSGPVIGLVVYLAIREGFRDAPELQMIVLGGLAVVIMLTYPGGIRSMLGSLGARVGWRRTGRAD